MYLLLRAFRGRDRVVACCLLSLLFLTTGCGEGTIAPKEYPGAHVEGEISVDGQPLETGTVMFSPIGGSGAPMTVDIVKGKFSCERAPLGKMKVVINSMKPTGKMITEYSEPYPELINAIPEKYRDGIDFELSGDNKNIVFDLKSK